MLTIRKAQLEALRGAVVADFFARLQRHLAALLGLPEARLAAELPALVDEARSLGLTRQCDVARYAEWMYRYGGGPTFDTLPKAARNLLLAYGVGAPTRLDRLEAWQAEQATAERSDG